MICEIYGKKSGCCGGRGGSMHLMDISVGMMLSLPIVASVIPIAVGAALSKKINKEKNIVVVFFGDLQWKKEFFMSLQTLPLYTIFQSYLFAKIIDIHVLQILKKDNHLRISHDWQNATELNQ